MHYVVKQIALRIDDISAHVRPHVQVSCTGMYYYCINPTTENVSFEIPWESILVCLSTFWFYRWQLCYAIEWGREGIVGGRGTMWNNSDIVTCSWVSRHHQGWWNLVCTVHTVIEFFMHNCNNGWFLFPRVILTQRIFMSLGHYVTNE